MPKGGELLFLPEVEGVEFNPPRHTFRWVEDVHRVDFRMRASSGLSGQMARGQMSVFLGAILLADIRMSIRVSSGHVDDTEAGREKRSATPYRKIFVSYSHHDLAIVEQIERHAESMGDRILRDWKDLRAGELWDDRLLEMIDEATVFQLFWSSNSMRSDYVRKEWEYALGLQRPHFVRPVYWEPEFPSAPGLPPETLARLHFQRIGKDASDGGAHLPVSGYPLEEGKHADYASSPEPEKPLDNGTICAAAYDPAETDSVAHRGDFELGDIEMGDEVEVTADVLGDEDLVQDGSGAGSDVMISEDSGISQVDPADGGLSADLLPDGSDETDAMAQMRPGGHLASRPLHFIWLVDCSGSMATDGKIQAVNNAIKDAIPLMQQVADENPNAHILVRAIKFSNGAQWHVPDPKPIEDFRWTDVEANGVTDLGEALLRVAEELRMPPMEERALPPVLVLLSDGEPTDTYTVGLDALFAQPWGQKAVRIAIAIGQQANTNVLKRFIKHAEVEPLQANSPESLVRYIKWCSTQVLRSASSPGSQATNGLGVGGNVPVPEPPESEGGETEIEIW